MALVRIDERTLVQKVKLAVLGKEKPNLFRRISVLIGFGVWLYFTIWQGLIFLSIIFMDRLKNPEMIKDVFNRVGAKYTFMHRWGLKTIDVLTLHSLGMFVFYGLSLFALVLIYRQKKFGHILYLLSNSFAVIFTIVFLGWNYFNQEISMVDKIIFGGVTLYFSLGIFFFKKSNLKAILIIFIPLVMSACSKNLTYRFVKQSNKCETKGGYWYNDKCWKGYEDDGIANDDIDSIVNTEMDIINKSFVKIDNDTYQLVAFLPFEQDNEYHLLTVLKKDTLINTLIIPMKTNKLENKSYEVTALLFKGDVLSNSMDKSSKQIGIANVNIVDLDNLIFEISGDVNNHSKKFSFITNEAVLGAGNSELIIKGDEAYLSGDLGTITYNQIQNLISNHPNIKTLVLTNISGSLNDAVNMHTGRLIRDSGLNTKVLSNSDIASGGVDLFCSGNERIVEKGAKIGVHSWCCVNDLKANEIPKNHPAHKYQLEYFTKMLGTELGPKFYFYTLEAAPFDDIYYMSDDEIKKWHISTSFIE